MFSVVDHLSGHTAIDADVFSGDKAGLVRAEKQYHMGDIQGVAYPACRLLDGIGAFIYLILIVDPAGGDGVDPDFACQADSQGVGQSGDAAFCRAVGFSLRLTHAVSAGGDVDNTGVRSKIGQKQLG